MHTALTHHMFDLDGTLIESYMDRPDKAFAPVVLLPGVAERWAYLRSETGNNLAIITNQAGVAYGYNSKDDVRRKLCVVGAALGYGWIKLHEGDEPLTLSTGAKQPGVLMIFVCYDKSGPRRKPSAGMLDESMRFAGYGSGSRPNYTQYVLYVGDRPEDEQAAQNAGVPFQWAERFFNGR